MYSYDLLFHITNYGKGLSIPQPPPALQITVILSGDLLRVSEESVSISAISSHFLLLSPLSVMLCTSACSPAAHFLVLQAYVPTPNVVQFL